MCEEYFYLYIDSRQKRAMAQRKNLAPVSAKTELGGFSLVFLALFILPRYRPLGSLGGTYFHLFLLPVQMELET